MQKRDLPYLIFGILITSVASCRSPIDPVESTTLEPQWSETSTAAVAEHLGPSPEAVEPTSVPPPPTALPPTDEWQQLGSDRAGLSLAVPASWANLTEQLDTPVMSNLMGVNLLFAADSEQTGRSLLAGKPFAAGAYVSGLIVTPPASTVDAAAALTSLLMSSEPTAVRLTPIMPIISANDVAGYFIDVTNGPIGLNAAAPNDLRTRIALYTPPAADGLPPSWFAVLLGASSAHWDAYDDVFDRTLRSVRVFNVRPGTPQPSAVIVRGALPGERDTLETTLEGAVNDQWTLTIDSGRYASLFLRPGAPHLDLTLTVLGPDRQTVARIDNGYTGAAESITDLPMPEPGVYTVEVGDFFQEAGDYTLSWVLADQPEYRGGGLLEFGQVLSGEMRPGEQHTWRFEGAAGQQISIVVEPAAATFDAILELYDPDGELVTALDEGFSGDPELLAGLALPVAGEYAAVVRSFSAQGGPYTISLDEEDNTLANFHDAGDLAYGSIRQEALRPQEAHAWFFQGQAGDYILVRASPLAPALDLDIWLLDERVQRVAAADRFAAGQPETLELTLAADGQYIVLVRDFNGAPGEYEIALGASPIATPENAGSLSYGDSVTGDMKPHTAVAWLFNAQAGEVITVAAQPSEPTRDIVLQLQGPDGLTALEADAGAAGEGETIDAFIVPAAGAWRLVLREYFGQATSYRLTLDRAP